MTYQGVTSFRREIEEMSFGVRYFLNDPRTLSSLPIEGAPPAENVIYPRLDLVS